MLILNVCKKLIKSEKPLVLQAERSGKPKVESLGKCINVLRIARMLLYSCINTSGCLGEQEVGITCI